MAPKKNYSKIKDVSRRVAQAILTNGNVVEDTYFMSYAVSGNLKRIRGECRLVKVA